MPRPTDENAGQSPMRPRGASRDERRQAAQVALRRIGWLLGPLVFWAGSPARRRTVPGAAYRPILELLGRRLTGLPAGVYSIQLTWSDPAALASDRALRSMCRRVNPRTIEVQRIAEREVSEAARSLRGIARHGEALREWIGSDPETWQRRAAALLPRLTAALNAKSGLDSGAPSALALEEVCWWIGTEDARPSRLLSDESLHAWLDRRGGGSPGAGWCAGWLLAGQRRLRIAATTERAKAAYRLGAAFPAWPIDALSHCLVNQEPGVLRPWLACARGKGASSPEGALFAQEAWWTSSGTVEQRRAPDLSVLPRLLAAVQRAGMAWERSGHAVRDILLRAGERARVPPPHAPARPQANAESVISEEADDDAQWVERVADAIRRRRQGARVTERGTVKLRNLIERLLHTRLGVVIEPDRAERVARALRGVEHGSGADLFGLCSELVAPKVTGPSPNWPATWSGLTGRLWGWGGEAGVSWIPGWMDHLAETMAPGARQAWAPRTALHLIELWSGAAGRKPANLARLGEVLATNGDKVVEWVRLVADEGGTARRILRQQQVRWMLAHPVCHLAKLGHVSTEEARLLARTSLIRRTVALVNRRPERLGAYLEFLRGLGTDTERVGPGAYWAWVFACAEDGFLAWALVQRGRWISGGSMVEGQAAHVVSELADAAENHPELGAFLVRHTALVDRILASASRQPANPPDERTRDFWADFTGRFSNRIALLELACAWTERKFASLEDLVDSVLRWWEAVEQGQALNPDRVEEPRCLSFPGWTVESVLVLSNGEVGHVCGVLALAGAPWFRWERIKAGWKYLAGIPGAHALVREAWEGKPGARAALELVSRFGMGTRLWLGPTLDHGLAAWQRAETLESSDPARWQTRTIDGVSLPPELTRELAKISAHRKVSGCTAGLPADLAALFDRPARWREECDRLKALVADGDGSVALAKRLANLERRLETPEAIASWVVKDLRRALPKAVFRARWESLGAVIDRALRRHWRRQFAISAPEPFDDDWQNALLLGAELSFNRALWRRLVRHEASGDRTWRWNHPGNRAWIDRARAAGIDTERWLGPHTWTATRKGELWRIHAEDNPLRVLQMGNWFDTCLQRSGMNNFSVVANAVEANKRVLYLTNGRGAVTGRKLVALMPKDGQGVLVGFRSYGATIGWHELTVGKTPGPWPKILFDLACARLARSVGAWLAEAGAATEPLADRCGLFAEWYNDGAEPFDWWIANRRFWKDGADEPDRDAVLIEAAGRFDQEKENARLATWRALVWLGEDARPLWEGLDPDTLSELERKHLAPTAAELGLAW